MPSFRPRHFHRRVTWLTVAMLLCVATPNLTAQKLDSRRKKALTALAKEFWAKRPPTRFVDWDAAEREKIMARADELGAAEADLRSLVDALWKPAKRSAPRYKKSGSKGIFETPYGDAWFHVRGGKGKGRGLVLGLHGGGEGAGSADEPAGTWKAAKCMGAFPQGIRLVHDTWNTVHGERFLLSIIEQAKIHHDIDPDRVYSMGFSMGGTGSWFMAGRHADLLAGAIPAAGVLMAEPKSQVPSKEQITRIQHGMVPNVRNLPMWYYIGSADVNCMPGTYLFVQDVLAELREEDPEGFRDIHFTYHQGLAHAFPPKEPGAGIAFIEKQTRNAFPEKIWWEYAGAPFPRRQDDDHVTRFVKKHFYWLRCESPRDRQLIIAERKGNTFKLELDGCDKDGLSILLNDEMIDPQKDVVVLVDGEEVWRGKPERSIRNILETLDARVDRTLIFDRRIDL